MLMQIHVHLTPLEDFTGFTIFLKKVVKSISTYRSDILAEKLTGIDLIIDSHSHTMLEEDRLVNGTLIAQTGEHNKNLGYVDLQIEDGKVTSKIARMIQHEEAK